MLFYYRNPRTEELIIYNSDENELFFLEKIKNIRVFTEKDVIKPVHETEKSEFPAYRKPKRKKGTKISPEMIQEMKNRKADGVSGREIAEDLGVSISTVFKLLNN